MFCRVFLFVVCWLVGCFVVEFFGVFVCLVGWFLYHFVCLFGFGLGFFLGGTVVWFFFIEIINDCYLCF